MSSRGGGARRQPAGEGGVVPTAAARSHAQASERLRAQSSAGFDEVDFAQSLGLNDLADAQRTLAGAYGVASYYHEQLATVSRQSEGGPERLATARRELRATEANIRDAQQRVRALEQAQPRSVQARIGANRRTNAEHRQGQAEATRRAEAVGARMVKDGTSVRAAAKVWQEAWQNAGSQRERTSLSAQLVNYYGQINPKVSGGYPGGTATRSLSPYERAFLQWITDYKAGSKYLADSNTSLRRVFGMGDLAGGKPTDDLPEFPPVTTNHSSSSKKKAG